LEIFCKKPDKTKHPSKSLVKLSQNFFSGSFFKEKSAFGKGLENGGREKNGFGKESLSFFKYIVL